MSIVIQPEHVMVEKYLLLSFNVEIWKSVLCEQLYFMNLWQKLHQKLAKVEIKNGIVVTAQPQPQPQPQPQHNKKLGETR